VRVPPCLHGLEHVSLWLILVTREGGVMENGQDVIDHLICVLFLLVPAAHHHTRGPVGNDCRNEAGGLIKQVAEVIFGDV
jgi:hypothetical protein